MKPNNNKKVSPHTCEGGAVVKNTTFIQKVVCSNPRASSAVKSDIDDGQSSV